MRAREPIVYKMALRRIVPIGLLDFLARIFGPIAALVNGGGLSTESRVRGIFYQIYFGNKRLRVGRRVEISDRKNVRISDDVTLYGDIFLGAPGPHGFISIASNTHIDRFTVVSGNGGVEIGDGCAISAGVLIYSQSNRYERNSPLPILESGIVYSRVVIGSDVWIGAGATVLPGVRIGSHAVIAAGAVVKDNVSEWQIVGGVPANLIGERMSREKQA